MDGTTWMVRVAGWSLTGRPEDQGAPLLHLTFHQDDASAPPVRELLVVAAGLDDFTDVALEACLARAQAYTEPKPPDRQKRSTGRGPRRGRP